VDIDTPTRRPRRQFIDEFKDGVVRLVLDDGKTVGTVASDMDLTETVVREWVKRARATGRTAARASRPPSARSSPGSAKKFGRSGWSATS
jgi:transposase-like protein